MRRLGLVLVVLAASCGRDAAPEAAPTTPSPSATVDDFHAEWCGAVEPYVRMVNDLPILAFDQRIADTANDTVTKLDALSIELDDAGLAEAAGRVGALADAVDKQADVLSSHEAELEGALPTKWLHQQAQAFPDSDKVIDPAVAELGRC